MLSDASRCHFVDTPLFTNVSLFMAVVDTILRNDSKISEPCTRTTNSHLPGPAYDFIVVGGGVAGSVVAGRLSERADWRVLLLEAGPEEPSTTSVPGFVYSGLRTSVDWKFRTEPQKSACLATGGVCAWPRGKMMGGTGAMTGMMYTRGHKTLYDDLAKAGNHGWSYEEVLPYFIKAENNKNPDVIEPEYHGTQGPLTVQRFPYQPEMTKDIVSAVGELGYRECDLNGKNQTGFAIAQMTVDGGVRASTARMYVRANSKRKNLVVKINSQVTRIIIDPRNKRAIGVELRGPDGETETVYAYKEVILSAGAVGSPHLLLLSGVGPKRELRKLGIPTVMNLPVGKNLHNHVASELSFSINDKYVQTLTNTTLTRYMKERDGPLASTGITQATGFIKTKHAVDEKPDIQLFFDGYFANFSRTGEEGECFDGSVKEDCGRRRITVRPTNIMPRSRGQLTLKSRDPLQPPVIDPCYFSDVEDINVLIEGLKFIMRLEETEALKKWGIEMDRRPVSGCEQFEFASDDYWTCLIKEHTGPENHQAGSCRMGPVGDPGAVVDPKLKVHGITHLRVADASVFPQAPNGNMIAAIVMVAEKCAHMIASAWQEPH